MYDVCEKREKVKAPRQKEKKEMDIDM